MNKGFRFLAAVLSALLLLQVLALPAATAGGGTDVWVNNVWLNSTSPYWKNGNAPASASDWNAYYNDATNTLTLKNASIDTLSGLAVDSWMRGLVYADGSVTVVLEGNNEFSYSSTTNNVIIGIYAAGALTVNGSGGAAMRISNTADGYAYGVYGDGAVTIASGVLDFMLESSFYAAGFFSNTGILFAGGTANVDVRGANPRVFVAGINTLRITGGTINGLASSTGVGNAFVITAETVYLEGGSGYFKATADHNAYGMMVGTFTLYISGGEFIVAGATKAFLPVIASDLLITGRAAYVSDVIGGAGASLFIARQSTTQTVPMSSLYPYRYVRFTADIQYPQTGDAARPWLWAGIALCALLAATGLRAVRQKRRST